MGYPNILLVGPYDRVMPTLSALLSAKRLTVTVSDTHRLDAVSRNLTSGYDATVIFVSETPNLQELRDVMREFPVVSFLLVTPRKPPRAALARVAKECGALIAAEDEGPVVVVATLYAMLAQTEIPMQRGP